MSTAISQNNGEFIIFRKRFCHLHPDDPQVSCSLQPINFLFSCLAGEQKYRNSPELQSGKKFQTGKEKTVRKQNRNEVALGNDNDHYKTDFDFEVCL